MLVTLFYSVYRENGWCSARKTGGFNRWKNLSSVLVTVVWTADTCRAAINRAECVVNMIIVSIRIVGISSCLLYDYIPFLFVSLFWNKGGKKKSIINTHKKNKSPTMCKVLGFEIMLGNERTDFTEEGASMSLAGTGNFFSNMCV